MLWGLINLNGNISYLARCIPQVHFEFIPIHPHLSRNLNFSVIFSELYSHICVNYVSEVLFINFWNWLASGEYHQDIPYCIYHVLVSYQDPGIYDRSVWLWRRRDAPFGGVSHPRWNDWHFNYFNYSIWELKLNCRGFVKLKKLWI